MHRCLRWHVHILVYYEAHEIYVEAARREKRLDVLGIQYGGGGGD